MGWLLLYYTLELFKWLIIVRAVMSWFVGPYSRNPLADMLRRVTDPILQPISRAVPLAGNIDLSPIIAFFAISILQQVIARVA